jgi:hypothetical protein
MRNRATARTRPLTIERCWDQQLGEYLTGGVHVLKVLLLVVSILVRC